MAIALYFLKFRVDLELVRFEAHCQIELETSRIAKLDVRGLSEVTGQGHSRLRLAYF